MKEREKEHKVMCKGRWEELEVGTKYDQNILYEKELKIKYNLKILVKRWKNLHLTVGIRISV